MASIPRTQSAEYERAARRKLGTSSLGLTLGNASKYDVPPAQQPAKATPATTTPAARTGGAYPTGLGVASRIAGNAAVALFSPRDAENRIGAERAAGAARSQPQAATVPPRTPEPPQRQNEAQAFVGPPEPLAGQADRVRDRLIQQELISRKQLGTIGRDEANAIAAQLRTNRREYDLADSSRRTPPPIGTATEYAEKARRSDQSLLEQSMALAKPLEDRVKAGETLSPEEADELGRYRKLADGYRSTLEAETTTTLPDRTVTSWAPNDAHYAERGEAGLRSATMRDAAFRDARAAERSVAGELYRQRMRREADAETLDRARAETALSEERARTRTYESIPQTGASTRTEEANARLAESKANLTDAQAKQIIDSLEKPDPVADAQDRLAAREAAAVDSGWTPDRANALAESLGKLGGFTSSIVPGVVNGSFWTGDIADGIQIIKEAEIDLAALEQQAASGDTSAQQEAARLLTQAMPPAPTGEYTGGFNPITVGVNPSTATSQRAAGEVLARKMNELRGRLASIAGKYAPR